METEVLKFRKRANPFSQVSNAVIQNENLSLQGRGLYCLIQSYINCPNFEIKKNFIVKKSGLRDAFQRYWNELKTVGLLIQYKLKDPKNSGRFYYEYELLDDIPETKSPDTSSSTSGFSVSGKQGCLNNTKENNIKKNNILNNNNITDNLFKNIRLDDENKKFFSVIELKLKKLIKTFNEEEFSIITSLSKEKINDFCLAVINLYNDKRITNKEGYIRTILKDIDSFIENYKNKTFMQEQLEQYDSSKNSEITKEEEEAFYKLRYGSI